MPGVPVYLSQSGAQVYAATFTGIALAAAATDVIVISGAAQRKITVVDIVLAATATAAAAAPLLLIKRTTLDTGGTPTAVVPVQLNPNQSEGALVAVASLATVLTYTANPTLGTATPPLGGAIGASLLAIGTATAPQSQFVQPITEQAQGAVRLLLPTDQLAINLNGATYAGGLLSGTIYFTDEGA